MNISVIPELLVSRARQTPDDSALLRINNHDEWESLSWHDYLSRAAQISTALVSRGLKTGDRIGIMARSSPDWDCVQLAILGARGIIVGLDQHDLDEHIVDIAERAGLSGLFVQEVALLDKFDHKTLAAVRFIVVINDISSHEYQGVPLTALSSLLATTIDNDDESWNKAQAIDGATIIFTSGTSGKPKGILYTHSQVCIAVENLLDSFSDIKQGSHLVCWLPLSNLFQRVINLCAIGRGAQIFYVENPREVMRYVPLVAPQFLIGVPRFYEKLYAGMMDRIEQGNRLSRKLAHWALKVGNTQASMKREGKTPAFLQQFMYVLAYQLVLRRFQVALGGKLRYMVSGSAAMPKWLLERFHAMGFLVLEAYGMSENIVPVAMNLPHDYRFGTVGRPVPVNQVKLADDSELLVRGPGVFNGYYGDTKDETMFDEDGFLHSGDYAEINEGYVAITGRKSEVFKTSTGRRVAPVTIEQYLYTVGYVEHALVYGAGRKSLVAILSLAADRLDSDKHQNIILDEYTSMIRNNILYAVEPLPAFLRPSGLIVTLKPFTIENGELTANLKLRRKNVISRYQSCIDKLYELLDEKQEPSGHECQHNEAVLMKL